MDSKVWLVFLEHDNKDTFINLFREKDDAVKYVEGRISLEKTKRWRYERFDEEEDGEVSVVWKKQRRNVNGWKECDEGYVIGVYTPR